MILDIAAAMPKWTVFYFRGVPCGEAAHYYFVCMVSQTVIDSEMHVIIGLSHLKMLGCSEYAKVQSVHIGDQSRKR